MNDGSPREVDDRLADWVDGRLGERERERFVAELRVNPQLRKDLEAYERTVGVVRAALRAPTAPSPMAERILAAIASERAAPAPPRASAWSWRHVWWSAASAAALLAIALWIDAWSSAGPTTTAVAVDDTRLQVADAPEFREAGSVGRDDDAAKSGALPGKTLPGEVPAKSGAAGELPATGDPATGTPRFGNPAAGSKDEGLRKASVAELQEEVTASRLAEPDAARPPAAPSASPAPEASGGNQDPLAATEAKDRAARRGGNAPTEPSAPGSAKTAFPVVGAGGGGAAVPGGQPFGGRGPEASKAKAAPADPRANEAPPLRDAAPEADERERAVLLAFVAIEAPANEGKTTGRGATAGLARAPVGPERSAAADREGEQQKRPAPAAAAAPLDAEALAAALDRFVAGAVEHATEAFADRWVTPRGTLQASPWLLAAEPSVAKPGEKAKDKDAGAKDDAAAPAGLTERAWLIEGDRKDVEALLARVAAFARARSWTLQRGEMPGPVERRVAANETVEQVAGGIPASESLAARAQPGVGPLADRVQVVLRVRLRPR